MTIAERVKVTGAVRKQPGLNVSHLIKEIISNRYCLGLLRFFVMHPNGRFSKLAVVHALDEDSTRPEIDKDLAKLVNEGVIEENTEKGTSYYLLTREEPTRRLVLNLAEFDWSQWQRLDHYYVAERRTAD